MNSDESEEELNDLPLTVKNYITPSGAERLKRELTRLLHVDRPETVKVVSWAASNGDRSENADYQYGKRKLREIDRRIHFLQKRLDSAEIIDPCLQTSEVILFGATVTVKNDQGATRRYHIVGIDEINIKLGKISWRSPIGKALLNAKAGQYVYFNSPKNTDQEELEILTIEYIPIPEE